MVCGTFIVDDFGFEGPPVRGSINGVSAPVNTNFKETPNTKTWESASVSLDRTRDCSKIRLVSGL